ncbi:CRM-domain containing factor CFM9, mitochondrial [Zea mays]|uniref:CRM-domain containing factor CFM3A chloroplastic/mitochondrial n=1 Tax=Zea mays TaxID=4577 RepID=A0A1D6J243_MAIZE|nr:CRM-domain containing factor CFM9, mitochondrial [Zea mays]AQK42115.1 CRM-domain containing factor CFM3A chloroplastic/mitochondrial [Zea mays]|eukprot:XP_020401299.1 CRM-domain containing factor CFM3, chloroplastic/mitochondrial [Zea mays]
MWVLRSLLRAASPSLRHSSGRFTARGEALSAALGSAPAPAGLLAVRPRAEGGWRRAMSTKGRTMRTKVEKRMARETGRTQRELRRAVKLRKKLMTEDEKFIYNLRRAKKKVALLLQKLKKYELPDLQAPRHDPELLTAEQLQAYKKIGFRNRNYVPVGVRGVFGGVVQNMHMHWKFHETVQVCCDNFPKEKIKEMAAMLTRLSGGIVINIHNTKTIIMFRGRNYRQPKNLIPFNTLTKRKALFKARFEQALESQKLNIKKIETQLRRKGINPEDPVAMASIQRVASTFFRAIDEQQGTPYIFRGDAQASAGTPEIKEPRDEPSEDSDQEELDRFISEIETAAEKQWEEEEAAEKEESSRMRYWEREDVGDRRDFNRSYENSDYEDRGQGRYRREHDSNIRTSDVRKWDGDSSEFEASGEEWDSGDDRGNALGFDNDRGSTDEHPRRFGSMRNEKSRSTRAQDFVPRGGVGEGKGFNRSYGNPDADVHNRGQGRHRRDNKRTSDARRWDDNSEIEASGEECGSGDDRDSVLGLNNDIDTGDGHPRQFKSMRNERSRSSGRQISIPGGFRGSNRIPGNSADASDGTMFRGSNGDESDTEDDDLWMSDYKGGETNSRAPKVNFPNFHSSGEDSDDNRKNGGKIGKTKKNTDESWDSD